MNSRKLLLIYIILSLLFLGAHKICASPVYSIRAQRSSLDMLEKVVVLDDVFWVYAATQLNISGITIPAGTTALVVVLKNVGEESVKNITAVFDSIKELGECNETVKSYNDTLFPHRSLSFVFKISPYENISASEYDLLMHIRYYYRSLKVEYDIIVPIAVTGYPLIKIHASPLYISGEGIYNYTVIIENIGTAPARHVTVTLIGYPPYVNVIGDDWFDLGIIRAGEYKTARFELYVTEAKVSGIPLLINVTFLDQRTNQIYSVAESSAIIYQEEPHVILMSSSYMPTSVLPGDKFIKIIVVMANPTSKLLENVHIELILPETMEPSYIGSTNFSIGAMAPGSHVQIEFYINIKEDAEPRMYTLILNVTFSEGYNIFDIPLLVKEKARFEIVDVEPNILRIGARGLNLRVTIRNIANVDAEGVYLQLMGGTIIKGEVITYVGKIVSGEKVTVTFTIDVSESAPAGYATLDLRVSWTQEGRVLSDIYKIRVYLTASFSSMSNLIILLGSLISSVLLIPIVREFIAKRKEVMGG